MMDRRQFIKNTTLSAGAVAAYPIKALGSRYRTSAEYFGIFHHFNGINFEDLVAPTPGPVCFTFFRVNANSPR